MICQKQIYFCWSSSTQSAYKFDDDPVKSAIHLLKNIYQCRNCELIVEKNIPTAEEIREMIGSLDQNLDENM